jgi:hypothetical protein
LALGREPVKHGDVMAGQEVGEPWRKASGFEQGRGLAFLQKLHDLRGQPVALVLVEREPVGVVYDSSLPYPGVIPCP